MATECYFRNPRYYIRELVEEGAHNVVFHAGYVIRRRIDPLKFVDLYMRGRDYRVLVVRDGAAVEYRPGDELDRPSAVYPTWSYGGDVGRLYSMIENPVGDDARLTDDETLSSESRPIAGQPHRIVLTGSPNAGKRVGVKFLHFVGELQEEYPNCAIHMYGYWSYKAAFGSGVASADVEVREDAARGRIVTPAGYVTAHEATRANPLWASTLGFQPAELSDPRNRCIYNIRSALWAARNFEEDVRFGVSRRLPPENPSKGVPIFLGRSSKKKRAADMIVCDACTLVMSCKFARKGSVCSVPESEISSLAGLFGSRDPEKIIDGLGRILTLQTGRLERGVASEEKSEDGALDPDVTRLAAQVFDSGMKLAKMLDPGLARPGVHVNINTDGGTAAVLQGSPTQLVSAVYRQLESQGIRREDITPELVRSFLAKTIQEEQPAQRELVSGPFVPPVPRVLEAGENS